MNDNIEIGKPTPSEVIKEGENPKKEKKPKNKHHAISRAASKATTMVVLYIFLSCFICSFVSLGGVWILIFLSHLIALAGGIAFVFARVVEYQVENKLRVKEVLENTL